MTIQRQSLTIPVSGVIETLTGNFCLFVTANASVNLRLVNGGSGERFDGVLGGLYLRRVQSWENLQIIGAAGTTVEFWIGYEDTTEDVTDIRLQITTIAGVASFAEAPSATITDTPSKLTVAATQAVLFAANLARRRITVYSIPENIGDAKVFIRKAGGVNDIGFIQPGTFEEFKTTAALDYRAVVGGDTLLLFEEV